MLVLICGDRNWEDYDAVLSRLKKLPHDSIVVEGGATGADTMAREAAKSIGLDVIEIRAEWGKYGRSAGPIRNIKMLEMGPELVIAFHSNLKRSLGTAHTVREAGHRGIPVEVILGGSNVED